MTLTAFLKRLISQMILFVICVEIRYHISFVFWFPTWSHEVKGIAKMSMRLYLTLPFRAPWNVFVPAPYLHYRFAETVVAVFAVSKHYHQSRAEISWCPWPTPWFWCMIGGNSSHFSAQMWRVNYPFASYPRYLYWRWTSNQSKNNLDLQASGWNYTHKYTTVCK